MERAKRSGIERTVVAVFAAAILAAGCGGGGSDGGTTTLLFPATLTDIQSNIFTPKCTTNCHQPDGEGVTLTQPTTAVPDGVPLDLTAGTSFSRLVNQKSVQSGCGINFDQHCGLRVAPGDPDNSYLIHKLENTGISFGKDPMPKGQTALSQDEINVIRQWITDGALDN